MDAVIGGRGGGSQLLPSGHYFSGDSACKDHRSSYDAFDGSALLCQKSSPASFLTHLANTITITTTMICRCCGLASQLLFGLQLFWHTPLQIIYIVANFLRIWSIYSMFRYLSQTGASVVLFLFACLAPASILFLILQKPWKGRPLSNTQVVPSIINGFITALYLVLWGKGLKSCGPVRAILGEYSGAVLGVLSAVLYGRRSHLWKKIGGLIAMLASFYLLSEGWATATYSPFSWEDRDESEAQTEQVLGLKQMLVPIFAGILSALRRVIARRVSIKNQLKRRLHALTVASATCFMFPIAMWDVIIGSPSDSNGKLPFSAWAFLSTILFGNIVIFYADSIAEERLHMVFSSPRHLMAAGACIIVMEIVYKMDFSLTGFVVCCLILGFGIYEATSLEHNRKDSTRNSDLSNGEFDNPLQMSSLPT